LTESQIDWSYDVLGLIKKKRYINKFTNHY